MITTFLTESLFVLGMLVGLGLAGGFAILPFRKSRRFVALAAPFAGLLVVVLGTATLYCITGKGFALCAGLSAVACVFMTLASLYFIRPKWCWQTCLLQSAAMLIVILVVTFSTDAATIRLGQPAVQYMDGTDHLGYAQMGDWLSSHSVSQLPRMTPDVPYEAFPELLFRVDARFGAYFTMALVRSIHGRSGAFSYDIACAIVLAAGILALAGAFGRSLLSILIVVAGLLSCHWYDYSRSGYFGKLLGYPACLLVAGLFLSADVGSPIVMFLLILLTAAAAIMHSGMVTALFLGAIIGGYLLCQLAMEPVGNRGAKLKEITQSAAALAALIVVAVVATGAPARTLHTLYPDYGVKWDYILPRILDLESQGVRLTSLSPAAMNGFLASAIAVWLALAAAAFRLGDSAAAGLLIGPLLLLLALLAVGARAAAFQMIGTMYPFSVCAAALLIDHAASSSMLSSQIRRRLAQVVILLLTAVCIGLRVPRYRGALERYAGKEDPRHTRFSKQDADRLATLMNKQPVQVDIVDPQRAVFALIELGSREGVHLEWSARSWDTIVGYEHWPLPKPEPAPRYRLVISGETGDFPVLLRTAQYELVDCSAGSLGPAQQ